MEDNINYAEKIENFKLLVENNSEDIAVKYLESLEKIADGRATKVFLPLESSGILGSVSGIAELFKEDK